MDKDYLQNLRHSCAHLLATAVKELWPGTHNAIGPSIENGFYQDLDFNDKKITEEDLPKIEAKMKDILQKWNKFEHKEVSLEEARNIFKRRDCAYHKWSNKRKGQGFFLMPL